MVDCSNFQEQYLYLTWNTLYIKSWKIITTSSKYKKILIEKSLEYEIYFYIPHEHLEKNAIKFGNRSYILNELKDEYLMLDAYSQGVWIPKDIVGCTKIEK